MGQRRDPKTGRFLPKGKGGSRGGSKKGGSSRTSGKGSDIVNVDIHMGKPPAKGGKGGGGKGGGTGLTLERRLAFQMAGGAAAALISSQLASMATEENNIASYAVAAMVAGGAFVATRRKGVKAPVKLVAAGIATVGAALAAATYNRKNGDPGLVVAAATTPSLLPAPGDEAATPSAGGRLNENWARAARQVAHAARLEMAHDQAPSPGRLGEAQIQDGTVTGFEPIHTPLRSLRGAGRLMQSADPPYSPSVYQAATEAWSGELHRNSDPFVAGQYGYASGYGQYRYS